MKSILVLLFISFTFHGVAQIDPRDYFIILDKDWQPTPKQEKAAYFVHVLQLPDSSWQWDYYNFSGPLIKSEMYKDEAGKIPNGFFSYYNKKGYLDSCGYVFETRKDRRWTYFRGEKGKVYKAMEYDKGHLLKTEDYPDTDKTPATKTKDTSGANKINGEVESEFVGGIGAWSRYLNTNMKYPDRALSLEVKGEVWILFIVDTEGKVIDPVIAKSVEYSLDQESLRIIKESPKWQPAIQDGRKVKSYKKQPIQFKLQYE